MPFPVVPAALTIIDNGTSIVVTDATVYTAPARNTLAIFVLLVNPTLGGPVLFPANPFDPELASVFTFQGFSVDGDYVANYWPVSYKTGAEVPVLNDFVWDAPLNQLQRWNGSVWVPATILDLFNLAGNFAFVKHTAHNPNFTLALARMHKYYVNGSTNISKEQLRVMIPEAEITLQGAEENFADGAFAEYQRVIEGYAPTVNVINSFAL